MIKTENSLILRILATFLALCIFVGVVPPSAVNALAPEDEAVAKIGEQTYQTLEEAINAVPTGADKMTPATATEIVLLSDTEYAFNVGNETGSVTMNISLDLGGNTLTLTPAVGSVGTVSSGIRVLAHSKLKISNGTLVCSDEVEANIKVGIANYSELELEDVVLKSGALTKYTINNRGKLTLSGATTVENGQLSPLSNGQMVAITNDPYNLVYTTDFDASLICDSADVEVGTVLVERYERVSNNNGAVTLDISDGTFDRIINDGEQAVDVSYSVSGGTIGVYNSAELAAALKMVESDNTNPVTVKLMGAGPFNHGFDVGNESGTKPQNIVLDLNSNSLTLNPAVGSVGTVSSGIRVLANSSLTVKNGTLICPDEVETNIKVGIANYSELELEDVVLKSGALTKYTINNRGKLILSGATTVENGQVAPNDYADNTGLVAITNDPYTLYPTVNNNNASLICDSKDVEVGNIQLECYGNSDKIINLEITAGNFGEVVKPSTSGTVTVDGTGVTGGKFANDITEIVGINKDDYAFNNGEIKALIETPDFSFTQTEPADQWVGSTYINAATSDKNTGKVTYTVVSGNATVDEYGEVTFNEVGKVKIKAEIESDGVYKAASAEYTVEAIKVDDNSFYFEMRSPTIIYDAKNTTYLNPLNTPINSTGTVSFEVVSGDCATLIDSKTGELLILKAGTIKIKATVEEDDKYKQTVAEYELTVKHAVQEAIGFDNTPDTVKYGESITVKAFGGSSEKAYEFSIISGNEFASIDAVKGEITVIKASLTDEGENGIITVEIKKDGDDRYEAATVTKDIKIEFASQTGFAFEKTTTEDLTVTFNDNLNKFTNLAFGGQTEGAISYEILGNDTLAQSEKVAVIDETTGEVTILKSGVVTVKATKLGDTCYNRVSASYQLEILRDIPEFTVNGADLTYGTKQHQITPNEVETRVGSGAYTYQIVGENNIGASVNENGLVEFTDSLNKVGSVTIKVTKQKDDRYEELSQDITINVAYLSVSEVPTVDGIHKNESGWYTGTVTITAPDGYLISYSNELSTSDWANSVNFNTTGINSTAVYLKSISEGYITDKVTVNDIKIDPDSPESLAISYSEGFWDKLLNTITFGVYETDEIEVTLTAKDLTSGVDYLTYNIGENDITVKSEDFLTNTNGVVTYKFTIPAQFRNQVVMTATDVAGNLSQSVSSDRYLVVDTIKPTYTVKYDSSKASETEQNHVDVDGTIYTKENITVLFEITEQNFDLRKSDPMFKIGSNEVALTWTFNEQNGVWTAQHTLDTEGKNSLSLTFSDASSNAMEEYTKTIIVDKTASVIEGNYVGTLVKDNIYNPDVIGKITVTETNFRASDVELIVSAVNLNGEVDVSIKNYSDYAKNDSNWSHSGDTHTLTLPTFDIDGSYTLTLNYKDLANVEAQTYTKEFTVDKTAPENIKIEYSEHIREKIIGVLTFGFYKEEVKVTVTAEDVTAGVDYFEYKYTKQEGASDTNAQTFESDKLTPTYSDDKKTATVTFSIPANARGTVSVKATDNANNSAILDGDKILVVDNIKPKVSADYTFVNDQVREEAGEYYTQSDVNVKFTITEANFDVANSPVVTVNAIERTVTWTHEENTNDWIGNTTISGNGDYEVMVVFADASTNAMPDYIKTIHIDNEKPLFDVSYNDTAVVDNIYNPEREAIIKVTEHNFKADEVELEVLAKDITGASVDLTKKAYTEYAKNPANWDSDGDVHTLTLPKFDIDGIYSVTLNYTDLSENAADTYTADFITDKTDPVNIKFEYSQSIISKLFNAVTFGFYQEKVDVKVTADDITSGVDYFMWRYIKEEGASDVNAQTSDWAKLTPTYSADKKTATVNFTIPANARGYISVEVFDKATNSTLTNDSGNILVADIKNPVVSVTYKADNADTKVQYTDKENVTKETFKDADIAYFNGDVTATVTINEANFFDGKVTDSGEVIHNVDVLLTKTNDNGTVEKYEYLPAGAVQIHSDAQRKDISWVSDGDIHKFDIKYNTDSEYVLKISYSDHSENDAQISGDDGNQGNKTYDSKTVVIDKTAPVVEVSYEPKDAVANEKYFNKNRIAKITVKEHNFRADEFDATITAKDVTGKDVVIEDFAAMLKDDSNWTEQDKNTHTIEFEYNVDANYTFDFTYKDLSENVAAEYQKDEFTVDKSAPTNLKIEYSKSIIDKLFNALTFGFYKEEVKVTVTADDITAGVDYFMWRYIKEEGASDVNTQTSDWAKLTPTYSADKKTATANFTIPANARGNVFVEVYDKATNKDEKNDTGKINIVDKIAPVINVSYKADNAQTKVQYTDKEKATKETFKDADIAYFNGDVTATVTINEANFFDGKVTDSGEVIHNVDVLLTKTNDNGTVEKYEYLPAGAVQIHSDAQRKDISWVSDGDIHKFDIKYDADAEYVLDITYTDLSENDAQISGDDGNQGTKAYKSKTVIVDKTLPVVSVKYNNEKIIHTIKERNSQVMRDYYDAKQSATITVEEHNFRADDFVAAISAVDIEGKDMAVEDFKSTLQNDDNWTHEGDVHTITIEYSVDANYTFDYTYKDLAENASAEYEEDAFTVDKTAPEESKMTFGYEQSILDKVIETITFGFYGGKTTVTITAEDDVSGIYYFVYSYVKAQGVSDVNEELLNEKIEEANGNITHDGKKSKATFTIPKDTLDSTSQFNGTVKFKAYDRCENNTEKADNKRIVVDNIRPNATITYNDPVQKVNDISYYAGNIDVKIAINEANFYDEDVSVTATKDGSEHSVVVKWTDESTDSHIGTFTLTEDGDYVITVKYKDRSDNEMDTYTSDHLILDTKIPTVNVTDIKANSANKDEKYGFTITANDINIDSASFKPSLTAVVRNEDGSYDVKNIYLGEMRTVETGKTYNFTVDNLADDAIYTLVCTVKDLAGNEYKKVVLDDGVEYDLVQFSVNRNGSTFAVNEYTDNIVNNYYIYGVTEDVVIFEVNVDPVEIYSVKLNGEVLTEGEGYTTSLSNNPEEWSLRTYSVSKELFEKEGEYSIVVESTDKTQTTAYSDVKNLNVSFVVDKTAPVLTISGLENGGRYQVQEQTVTVIPTDDGGRLNSLKVIVFDSDSNPIIDEFGKDISVRFEMSGEEFLNYLNENDGKVTFTVPEGLESQVQIICNDCSVNTDKTTNEYNQTFKRVTVSQSTWIIFYANKPLFYGAVAGVVILSGLIALLVIMKKRKAQTK